MPISLHGDGVPVTGVGRSWSKSYDALTWTSCVASGDTVSIFNFIVGMFKDAACVIDDKEYWAYVREGASEFISKDESLSLFG